MVSALFHLYIVVGLHLSSLGILTGVIVHGDHRFLWGAWSESSYSFEAFLEWWRLDTCHPLQYHEQTSVVQELLLMFSTRGR